MEAVTRSPTKAAPRHFLDLDRVSGLELRRMLDQAVQIIDKVAGQWKL